MKIGKKEVGYSTIQYIISTLSAIIVMAIVLANISTEEYAIWNVFLSIQSFVVLLDSGFGSVAVRYISYAVSGAEEINIEGLPRINDSGQANYRLYAEVYNCTTRIYARFSIAGFGILFIATSYIVYISRDLENLTEIIICWLLFSIAVSADMYYTYMSNILKGSGKIKENSVTQIWVAIISSFLKIVLVLAGMELLGLVVAYFVQIVVTRILMYYFLKPDLKKIKEISSNGGESIKTSSTYRAIMKNSKQMTWITVSDFITGKGRTLVCSTFLPLVVTGSFSVSSQMIGMVYSICMIPYSTFRFKWGELVPRKDKKKSGNVYAMVMLIFVVGMIVGTVFCVLFGNAALQIVKSETKVLSPILIFLLGIYQLVIGIVKISTGYIQYNNIQPYVISSVISSFGGVLLAVVLMMNDMGILGYLLALIITQAIYNMWKWPKFALDNLNMKLKDIPIRGYEYILSMMPSQKAKS